jgi:hypothetical protein
LRKTLAAAVLLLVLALAAQAGAAAVPGAAQDQMKTVLGTLGGDDFAFVPTYLPHGYRYDSFSATTESNEIQVSSTKFGPNSMLFSVGRTGRKAANCGKGSIGSVHLHGVTAYLSRGGAWRCVKAPSGHLVVVTVVGQGVTRGELGAVAASAVRAR